MSLTTDLAPPLGAHADAGGTTFAVFAGGAEAVDLCLFDGADGRGEGRRIPLTQRIHGTWFGHVPHVRPGQRYGYRVRGPWRPDRGVRHNHAKLLLDPYARGIDGEVAWRPEVFGHVVGTSLRGDLGVRDDRDSAPFVPRSVVVDDAFDWGQARGRRVPWPQTVLYETHVRGATIAHPGVPEPLRGTYAGLAHPAFVEHLHRVGVTTLELLPVHAFAHELHLTRHGLRNYWGYNTLAFFAPHRAYSRAPDAAGALREFKTMVRDLHAAGIEVILDVVYNHTAEQGQDGPTLSWRGLDQVQYYRLDARGQDVDVTGCGNTLDMRGAYPLRLVLDSLRYWVQECHVDGFRFDLAVALARGRNDEYHRANGFLMALRTDPVLSGVKLIAEPWDVGLHGWRTGQFPPPLAEWNDRFRDCARTFWLPDIAARGAHGHGVQEVATRLAGSEDLFGHHDRGPIASVNYVASHDGFTLADATAYHRKHNAANGEGNRDGHGDNRSWNHGKEGRTDDPEILARRRRSIRNLLAMTLLSTGVPMICAGDEAGRTQGGNNNAYCQDNDTSWLDWDLQPWREDLIETTGYLTRIRAGHRVFRQATFFTSIPRPGDGRADVVWYGRYGEPMTTASWEDPRCRVLQMLLLGDDLEAQSFLLVLQGKHVPEHVTLPPIPGAGHAYHLVWDSGWERPDPAAHLDPAAGESPAVPGTTLRVPAATFRVYQVITA